MLIMGNQIYHDGKFTSLEEHRYETNMFLDKDCADIEFETEISQLDCLYDIGYIEAREHYYLIQYTYNKHHEKLDTSIQDESYVQCSLYKL